MQENKKKLEKHKDNLKQKIKQQSKAKKIILLIIAILMLCISGMGIMRSRKQTKV